MEIKDALKKFTYGVYVVGVDGPQSPNFMTAAWVTRVSEEPPLVGVAVANTHYTCELLAEQEGKNGVFGVSVLGKSRGREIAAACGKVSGRSGPKLPPQEHLITEFGAPVVKDSMVYISCRLRQSMVLGDHTLFIGEVLYANGGGAANDTPLGRRDGGYF